MKHLKWQILFGISLVSLSALVYLVQIEIFKTPRDTFFYIFQDLAFVPISVLMVTLIIDQVLRIREKRALLKKMNMVIGAFFSEVGTDLLKLFAHFDLHYETLSRNLIISDKWSEQDFSQIKKQLKNFDYKLDSKKGDLEVEVESTEKSYVDQMLQRFLSLQASPPKREGKQPKTGLRQKRKS